MKTNVKMIRILNVLLGLVLICSLKGWAQAEREGDKTLSPYFFVSTDDATLDALPLKATSAEVNIAGVIASVKVKQTYKNQGRKTLEAIYVFPASTRAAVHAMRMRIGERVIEADIMERGKAREDYEKAKAQGKSASLLEQQRPNVFQMNVANILPGDEIHVEMDYTEILIPEKGVYELVYPTVVGPRYSNQPAALAGKNDLWIANPYTTEGVMPMYTFDISCNLNAGMPVSDVRCSSHEVNVDYENPSKAAIRLKDRNSSGGNRDFILQYRLSGSKVASGVLLYEGKDENFFLAMIHPPKKVAFNQIPPREYVFIVDVSGSMNGFPLDISKKLMKDLFSQLRPVDMFNVLLFAGSSQVLHETSLPATPENVIRAITFLQSQRGGGGTELLPALKRALALGSSEDLSRTFVIATDGYVSVEKESFELIRKNLGQANFFAFGIGSAVNRYLIEGIAHAGMGLPFIVTKQDQARTMAEAFMEYIRQPVLTDIAIEYKGIEVYDVEPYAIPDVFSERPVVIFGKYKGKTTGASITMKGVSGDRKYTENVALASSSADQTLALRYLWAREKIRHLDDFGIASGRQDEEGTVRQITDLGIKYNLLTRYTSFIAIDSESRNKDGKVTTVSQPLPLPEGVSNLAVGGSQTATSTGSVQQREVRNYSSPMMTPCLDASETVSISRDKKYLAPKKENKEVMEETAHFPGGSAALQAFLRKNLVYPAMAKNQGISGVVFVSFTIDAKGNIKDVTVKKGIGGGCDEEAIRLILSMPAWIPARHNGKAVTSEMTLPVRFRLP